MPYFLFALLVCASAASAQQPPAAPQQPPASSPAEPAPGIKEAIKFLSVLKERAAEIPAERMRALQPELAKFTDSVKDTLGKEIVAEVAAGEKEAEDKKRTAEALELLRSFRASLQIYFSETGGKYPKTPAALVPHSMTAVPRLLLPGHELTGNITIINSRKFDKNYSKAVKDIGGWLYFSDPHSINYGLLLLDCTHQSPDGVKFFEY